MLSAVASLGLLATSCDPVKESGSYDTIKITAEQLMKDATFKQCAKLTTIEGADSLDENGNVIYEEAADGNYIFYSFPAVNSVVVFNYNQDGSEFDLSKNTGTASYGSGGMFALVPARGSDNNQTVYFRFVNAEGEEVIGSKEFNVFVPADISAELKLLTSNAESKKTWTWDLSVNGGGWGNAGYKGDSGENFAATGSGTWWACAPADLAGQLDHAVGGKATGAEDPNAYMTISATGLLTSYAANGNKIATGTFDVRNYTGKRDADNWSLGTFHTSDGIILWPFEMNAKSNRGAAAYVTDYEIIGLTADKLVLCYPDGGSQGAWGECAWWRFKKVQ